MDIEDEGKGFIKVDGLLGRGGKQLESKLWKRTRIAVEDHVLCLCRASLMGWLSDAPERCQVANDMGLDSEGRSVHA